MEIHKKKPSFSVILGNLLTAEALSNFYSFVKYCGFI
jgi:hypothetical protein